MWDAWRLTRATPNAIVPSVPDRMSRGGTRPCVRGIEDWGREPPLNKSLLCVFETSIDTEEQSGGLVSEVRGKSANSGQENQRCHGHGDILR
jgi:hypothetical protein